MKFTGERVIAGEGDIDLFNEHRARYLFAQRYSSGKRILDAACGSGYGSEILARNAAAVFGVDIHSEAVDYSRRRYASERTHFAQADCLALPFASAQFDLIVAFEIIEHLDNSEAFLRELKRVLQPSGLLLLSTPNRLYYTDDRGERNPFHKREYSFPEFDVLLQAVFPYRTILFQNHIAGLLLTTHESRVGREPFPPGAILWEPREQEESLRDAARAAHFMIAVCSMQPLGLIDALLYFPSTGNVLRERETHIRLLAQQLRDQERELMGIVEERTQWARALDQKLAEKDAYLLQLQSDYEGKIAWAQDLERELERARTALVQLQKEFEERTAWALQMKTELQGLNAELRGLYESRWYRVGRKLRLNPSPPSNQTPHD
jgi:SAM-dependent methyltransferase